MKKILLLTTLLCLAILQVTAQIQILPEATATENVNISSSESIAKNLQTPNPTNQQQLSYIRPTGKVRFKRYLNDTFGTGLIGVGFSSVIGQISKTPPDWKKDGKGFGQRFASNFGENLIQETVSYGLEEALRLDSKFYKSQKRDFGARFKNALLSGVTARNPNGKRVFNPAPIVGFYTANIVSTEVWYPKRYSYKDGFRQGTQSIGFSVGFGLINEFLFNRK